MIKSYKLFSTPMCPKCPTVKDFMREQDKVKGEFFDAHTPEGLEEARKYIVHGVPTVILFDENDKEIKRLTTVEELKTELDNI